MKTKRLLTQLLIGSLITPVMGVMGVHAAGVTSRNDVMGSSAAGVTTTHQISFTTPTGGLVGSVGISFCTTVAGACTIPGGLSSTSASLTAQSGATGFSIVATSNGAPYLTRSAAVIPPGTALSYTLSNIVNPGATNTSFYVRVATYSGTDGATGLVDSGVIAVSTSSQIVVSGTMPESLVFCVGTSGTDCTSMTGNAVNLGIFSPTVASVGTSVMSASTNASSGYVITLVGSPMQSGANTIPAMGTQTLNAAGTAAATVGQSQFGTNLRANTVPVVGADASGLGSGSVVGGYASPNGFRFFSGDTVASAVGPTKDNLYTNSYVVNVGGDQAAGNYASTLTYICTATF
jgi:hypothetical protein